MCEYWFKKDQNRIRDLRIDTLSQMLNLAGIRPGGRYIAVDDASGLLVSGILERLGGMFYFYFYFYFYLRYCRLIDIIVGSGRLITICDADSPPAYPVMTQMNFSRDSSRVLSSLNWATADEEYTPRKPFGFSH